MRRVLIVSCLGALMMVAALAAGMNPAEEKAKETAAKAQSPSRLDVIKKLQGDWVQMGEDGKPTDQVISTYRVTAGGSAVEEVIFRGTPHEMVTVYYMDGSDLVLTHYCVAGNQPKMKAEKQSDAHQLVFHCAGGTNMKSENDEHMHQATITWKDDDHIHSEWLEFKDGKNIMTAAFDLARK